MTIQPSQFIPLPATGGVVEIWLREVEPVVADGCVVVVGIVRARFAEGAGEVAWMRAGVFPPRQRAEGAAGLVLLKINDAGAREAERTMGWVSAVSFPWPGKGW